MKGAFDARWCWRKSVISGIERHCEIRVIGVLEVVSVVAGTCPKEAVGGTNAEFGTSVCQETGANGHSPCSHQSSEETSKARRDLRQEVVLIELTAPFELDLVEQQQGPLA